MEASRSCALAAFLGSSAHPDLQFCNQDSPRWKLVKEVAGWEAPSLGVPGFQDLCLKASYQNQLLGDPTAYIEESLPRVVHRVQCLVLGGRFGVQGFEFKGLGS